jgi:small-conductance mechanosensitive channel
MPRVSSRQGVTSALVRLGVMFAVFAAFVIAALLTRSQTVLLLGLVAAFASFVGMRLFTRSDRQRGWQRDETPTESWEKSARHIVRTSLTLFIAGAVGGFLVEYEAGSRNVWLAVLFGLACASIVTYQSVVKMREIRRNTTVDNSST